MILVGGLPYHQQILSECFLCQEVCVLSEEFLSVNVFVDVREGTLTPA
jgi:hypothetical protein